MKAGCQPGPVTEAVLEAGLAGDLLGDPDEDVSMAGNLTCKGAGKPHAFVSPGAFLLAKGQAVGNQLANIRLPRPKSGRSGKGQGWVGESQCG